MLSLLLLAAAMPQQPPAKTMCPQPIKRPPEGMQPARPHKLGEEPPGQLSYAVLPAFARCNQPMPVSQHRLKKR